ncbi:MAG: Immunoglobulin-like domain of spore germination [Chloroflexi bacterium]|nr:MAG: Immunoglobulin-like domain of spore germination [Chloroflexota bacterium]
MRAAIRSRRLLWLLLGIAIIASLAVAGEIRGSQAGAQAPLVHSQDLPPGPSLVGWVGLPTTSTAILAAHPEINAIWWLDPADDAWILDAPALPPVLRPTIPFDRGDGFLAIVGRANRLHQPLQIVSAGAACPPNPSPTASDGPPAITITTPLAGSALGAPLTITSLAGTFEANVQARLLVDGAEIAFTFGTAAEAFVLSPYTLELPFSVAAPTPACLQAFTDDARDGARILIVQIPLILVP